MRAFPMLLLLALPACDDASSFEGLDIGTLGPAQARNKDDCTVHFRWLQKDAYKETAGRTTDLWPPHTTTEITATCTRSDGQVDRLSGFMANHGTEPGEEDPNGDVFLQKVKGNKVDTTRGKVRDLLKAYEDCECGTEFLTMDALDDAAIQAVMDSLVPYLYSHLDCGGDPTVDAVVGWLVAGDIETVVQALPECTWFRSDGLQEGLDEALLDALGGSLDGYHVCNDDAVLQADLWERFRATGEVGSCNPGANACAGPMWFYAP